MVLYKGSYTISSHDDVLRANGSMDVKGSTCTLSSDGDGAYADNTPTIHNGTIQVKQSYEGVETNTIQTEGGALQVKVSDDSINAAGDLGNPSLIIDGGTIYVDADEGRVDDNQDIAMSDGTLVIIGSESGGNGALNYDGSFAVNGKTLVAVGSSDMAMAPPTSSIQPSPMTRTDNTQPAETILYVQNEDSEIILGVSPVKVWQNVVISTGTLGKGNTYDIYVGGSASSVKNDVSTNTENGTLLASVTLNDVVSTYGSVGILQGPQEDGRHP